MSTQNTILFSGGLRFSGASGVPVGSSITLNVYRSAGGTGTATIVYVLQLTAGMTRVTNNTNSVDFFNGDTYYATLVIVGNAGSGNFTASLLFY